MEIVTITTAIFPNSVYENNLLLWQLISGSHTHVNKPFAPIQTLKSVNEDIA